VFDLHGDDVAGYLGVRNDLSFMISGYEDGAKDLDLFHDAGDADRFNFIPKFKRAEHDDHEPCREVCEGALQGQCDRQTGRADQGEK